MRGDRRAELTKGSVPDRNTGKGQDVPGKKLLCLDELILGKYEDKKSDGL